MQRQPPLGKIETQITPTGLWDPLTEAYTPEYSIVVCEIPPQGDTIRHTEGNLFKSIPV